MIVTSCILYRTQIKPSPIMPNSFDRDITAFRTMELLSRICSLFFFTVKGIQIKDVGLLVDIYRGFLERSSEKVFTVNPFYITTYCKLEEIFFPNRNKYGVFYRPVVRNNFVDLLCKNIPAPVTDNYSILEIEKFNILFRTVYDFIKYTERNTNKYIKL